MGGVAPTDEEGVGMQGWLESGDICTRPPTDLRRTLLRMSVPCRTFVPRCAGIDPYL